MLAGAFSSGKGLPASKEEKREAAEIAELKAFEKPPSWASSALFSELLSRSCLESTPAVAPSAAPFSLPHVIVGATAVARIEKGEDDDGRWWAVRSAPKEDQVLILCLSQDGKSRLKGVAAWWPTSSFDPKKPLRADDAARVLAIYDLAEEAELPAADVGHVTVIGVGENNVAPTPAQGGLSGPSPLHLAECTRLALLAKQQVNARLQRAGASASEKAHIKVLLKEANARLGELASPEPLSIDALSKNESATAGLRKMYLHRDLSDRCSDCGTRHSSVESGTCKFWIKWAADARVREEAAVCVPVEAKAKSAPAAKAAPAVEAAQVSVAAAAVPNAAAASPESSDVIKPFMPRLRAIARESECADKENAPAVDVA